MRERGNVKFYDSRKGFGYIKCKGKREIRLEKTSFKGKAPSKGDCVEFDVIKKSGDLHAKNLQILINPNYKLPSDTREHIRPQNIDNFGLRLNKTPFYDFDDDKFQFYKKDRRKVILNVKPDYSKVKITSLAERHRNSIKQLNIETLVGRFKPTWRMIVGLGQASVYETSLTLHHIYGIPYIPGSALKGIIRSYIITERFQKNNEGELDLKKAEKRALTDQGFTDIFGTKDRRGKIIFFDVLPQTSPKIKVDVMNPHYGPYYSDNKAQVPPADYHNPKPIFFLTVEDTEFEFIIGLNEKDNTPIQKGIFSKEYPLSKTFEWMKKALEEHGIGAKTSVGYGYMNGILQNSSVSQ